MPQLLVYSHPSFKSFFTNKLFIEIKSQRQKENNKTICFGPFVCVCVFQCEGYQADGWRLCWRSVSGCFGGVYGLSGDMSEITCNQQMQKFLWWEHTHAFTDTCRGIFFNATFPRLQLKIQLELHTNLKTYRCNMYFWYLTFFLKVIATAEILLNPHSSVSYMSSASSLTLSPSASEAVNCKTQPGHYYDKLLNKCIECKEICGTHPPECAPHCQSECWPLGDLCPDGVFLCF